MSTEPFSKSILVDLLRGRAAATGDKEAFQFISGSGGEEQGLTYAELDRRAMAIGAELQASAAPGQRVLLLFPPGLDFVTAFFGCLYAGVVAVPAAPPGRNRVTSSVEAIFDASQPSLVLSSTAHRQLAQQSYSHLSRLFEPRWIATDEIDDARQIAWRDPRVDGEQIAFLQYTSGSTSSPKGVMLSHANLLYNASLICHAFGNTPERSGVFWLPLYHDMGLIGGVVQPVYCGASCALLAPAAFLQRPALWLETISRKRASVSGGPDFAYDLCARKVSAEEREELDLSSWQVAFTGAERIRAETIERFADVFGPCGFRRESFFPCYGLAEATLMVSGGPRQTRPTIVRLSADALAHHRVEEAAADDPAPRVLVGSGENLPGQKVVIVDPQTRVACADGTVGEIWVQGPSVAGGYFQQPEATAATFDGRLADTGEGPFLRTGDLGFLRDGQLFVTGRRKDVIIIRGRNYYPEDIERSIERAHAAFRVGYCAAFSVDVEDRERLVVVQEIEPRQRHVEMEPALQAIRRAIAADHEVEVYSIVLAKAGEIPKTSSGKTRRSASRQRFLSGEINALARWTANHEVAADLRIVPRAEGATVREIEKWLSARVAGRLRLSPEQVHVTTAFLDFGMGSVDAVEIAAELERWLGRRISPTAIYNYPNIAALAQWLATPPEPEAAAKPSRAAPSPLGPAELDPERLRDEVQQMSEQEMQSYLLEMAKQ